MKRIAWVTPFTKKSAIANISKQVTDELKKFFIVDIYTDSKDELFDTKLKVFSYSNADDVNLSDYDHLIYQMGNFAEYHRGCFDLLKKYGGIVVQHDQTMLGFFYEFYLGEKYCTDPANGNIQLKKMIKKHYDEEGIIFYERALSGHGNVYDLDLLKEVFQYANAVFTHASFFTYKIATNSNIPTSYSILPLVNNYAYIDDSKKDLINSLFNRDRNKLLVVTTGIVHPLKRIDKVVDVILSDNYLKDNIQLLIIGGYGGEFGEKLFNLSQKELKNTLFMLGYQDDDVMRSAIYNADICVNLRYPNSEVCSLSILEQMVFGKPCIVLDTGFFGELPDNAVLRTNLRNEAKDILRYLTNAINERDIYKNIGENAKIFIETECKVERYVEKFKDFLANMDINIERANLENNIINSYKRVLNKLGFSDEGLPKTFDNIADNIYSIFNDNLKNKLHKQDNLEFYR